MILHPLYNPFVRHNHKPATVAAYAKVSRDILLPILAEVIVSVCGLSSFPGGCLSLNKQFESHLKSCKTHIWSPSIVTMVRVQFVSLLKSAHKVIFGGEMGMEAPLALFPSMKSLLPI